MSNPPTDDIYLRGGKVIQAEVNGKSLVVNKVKSEQVLRSRVSTWREHYSRTF